MENNVAKSMDRRWFAALALVLAFALAFIVSGSQSKAIDKTWQTPAGYSDNDYQKLLKLVNTGDNNSIFHWNEQNSSFQLGVVFLVGVLWNDETPKRVTQIVWEHPDEDHGTGGPNFDTLRGSLDLSGFDALKRLDIVGIYDDIDLTGCTSLENMRVYNIINGTIKGLDTCNNLLRMEVWYWPMKSDFKFSSIPLLESVSLGHGESFDFSSCANLKSAHVSGRTPNPAGVTPFIKLDGCNSLGILYFNMPIKELDFSKCTSLKGLEVFASYTDTLNFLTSPSMESLKIEGSNVSALNFSDCPALTMLDIDISGMKTLDLSNLPALTSLNTHISILKALDVTKVPLLKELTIISNQLTALDLSKNVDLEVLLVEGKALQQLDLRNNLKIKNLNLSSNLLSKTKVSSVNRIKGMGIVVSKGTVLDFSRFAKLTALTVEGYVPKGNATVNIKKNRLLQAFDTKNVDLNPLDLSGCPNLAFLYSEDNGLRTLDISKNPKLAYLTSIKNKLTKLSLDKNPKLQYLYVAGSSLTSLDLRKNPNVVEVNCKENKLTDLKLPKAKRLKKLNCLKNSITSLDLRDATSLLFLDASNNRLKNVRLGSARLSTLNLNGNRLSALDISKVKTRMTLLLRSNSFKDITKLKMPLQKYIERFDISKNYLDVRKSSKAYKLFAALKKQGAYVTYTPQR